MTELRRITFTCHPVAPHRRHYVGEDDVRVVLSRLPPELLSRLREVHFSDDARGNRLLGWTFTRGRRNVNLCALPVRVSLNRVGTGSQATFGAILGSQWPVRAVRRYMLYHTLLHEIGHLQVVLPKSSNPKRKFADETLAEEFAKTWRKRLWAEHFAHPDPVHNAPDDEELAALEQGWSGGHLCYRRGLDLDRRGHRREAVRALQEAISHYPNHALALERLGGLVYAGYAGEEEPECFVLAASLCRRALAQDPMLCHATTVLGMALYRLGQHDSARSAFQRAAVIDPYQYIAKTVYAEHLGYWGEYDEAERLFEKILAKEPRHGMALLHYGGMLLYRTEGGDEGSTRRAIELLQRALAEGSGHACHYDLGIAYFRLGDRESAVRHMEEAVRLAADYRDAADLLAEWRAAREKI